MALAAIDQARLSVGELHRNVPHQRGAVRCGKRPQRLALPRVETEPRRLGAFSRFLSQATLLPLVRIELGERWRFEPVLQLQRMTVQATAGRNQPVAAFKSGGFTGW